MHLHRTIATAFAAALALGGCGGADDIQHPWDRPHQQNADIDWRDQVIYQIVIDRFDNGDVNNDYNIAPTIPGRYHGGDWQGVIDRLDYLEELGVTALWISPVVKNTEEDAGFHSYHGYWTSDFLRTNPHFGDLLKLRELVDAAHERGMLVLMDVVTNHVGQLFYYDINGNGAPDDFIQGGGTSHTCVQICNPNPERCTDDELTYCREGINFLERIIEWDPEYDPRGVQGWTSLGFHGPATIRFPDWPEKSRQVPPRPPEWFGWPEESGWFDDPAWYNRRGRVYVWWREGLFSNEFVREQEVYGDFPGGLKDLNTDHPDVQEALIRIFQYWVDVTDVDGFRIDTAKHIDRPELDLDVRGFWGAFLPAMRSHAASLGKHNFFMFGEAFDGNDQLIGAYTSGGSDADGDFGRFDSVFYFSHKFRVIDAVFKQAQPTKNVECMYQSRMGLPADPWCQDNGYPAGPTHWDRPHRAPEDGGIGIAPQQAVVTFLDNHDLPRFLYEDATVDTLRTALFYLLTFDGIPCIYYGTEQLFDGGVDPANREDMWAGQRDRGIAPFDTTHEHFAYTRDLIALRKEHVALRRGDVVFRWASQASSDDTDEPDAGVVAFERVAAEETLLVVINVSDDHASTTCSSAAMGETCMETSFAPGTVLTDIAPQSDGASVTVASDGTVKVDVPPRTGRLLVAQ